VTGFHWETVYSIPSGDPVRILTPDMPRFSQALCNVATFIYRTREDAERDAERGASGFVVAVEWTGRTDREHVYLVTNKHVIDQGGLVARLNLGGASEVIETTKDQWVRDAIADLAVCPLEPPEEWNTHRVTPRHFLTPDQADRLKVGAGDEVFVVGRHTRIYGRPVNTPVIHTGNIAVMEPIPIRNDETVQEESSNVVELRSRSGYSGAPVFGYFSPNTPRFGGPPTRDDWSWDFVYLVGVLWAHLHEDARVLNAKDVETGDKVKIPWGFAAVVPASRLTELLTKNEGLTMARKSKENEFEQERQRKISESGVEPLFDDGEDSIERTKKLMGKLIQLPKSETPDDQI
jgi:hypothetical protein